MEIRCSSQWYISKRLKYDIHIIHETIRCKQKFCFPKRADKSDKARQGPRATSIPQRSSDDSSQHKFLLIPSTSQGYYTYKYLLAGHRSNTNACSVRAGSVKTMKVETANKSQGKRKAPQRAMLALTFTEL